MLPDYFILPFQQQLDSLQEDFDFFGTFGIDCGLFFDETINIIYNNMGVRHTHGDFDDLDYIWISIAYDTYNTARDTFDAISRFNSPPDDIESFHMLYASIVEKIFNCINHDIEAIMNKYGSKSTFNIHFVCFLQSDLLLKVEKH